MAQTGYTPILIYSSSTTSNVPAAGNLTNSTLGSELAINITDGKLFYKDNANAVQVIGWKVTPTSAGGTGLTSYTAGDTLYYASGTTLSKLAIGGSGYYMSSSGTAPQWSAPAALTKTDDTNVTLTLGGSASTALLNAASLTLGWTGQLAATRGGTGTGSYAVGDLLYASSTTALSKLTIGTAYYMLGVNAGGTAPSWQPSATSVLTTQGDLLYASAANTLARLAKNTTATRYLANTGSSNNPAWDQINLANGVTGTLGTTNGGTGLTSFTANGLVYASSTSALATSSNATFDGTNLSVLNGYVRPAAIYPNGGVNDTGGTYDYYWKIGTITLTGSQAAKITVRGAQAYGGSSIANEIHAVLRATNAGTIFAFQFGSTMNVMFNDFGYVSTGSNNYDIYVKQNQDYNNTFTYVDTNGTWTPLSVNTGSTSAPASFNTFTKRWSFAFSGGEAGAFDANSYLLVGYATSNGAYKLQVNSQIFATSATIATSDLNYKENIKPLDGALDLVMQFEPIQFNWKKHPVHDFDLSAPTVGFGAQKLREVLKGKEYVNSIIKSNMVTIPATLDDRGNIIEDERQEEFLGIAEGNLVAVLTKAVQELKAQFDAYVAAHP